MHKVWLSIFVAVQVIVLGVLATVPFGFDHPSSAGLDFDDWVLVAALYCLALAGGVVVAITIKRPGWILAQLAFVLVAILVSNWSWFSPFGVSHAPIAPAEEKPGF